MFELQLTLRDALFFTFLADAVQRADVALTADVVRLVYLTLTADNP